MGNGICWHCGRRLHGTHAEVKDQAGFAHKVHKSCKKEAEESVEVVTAQAAAYHGDIDGDLDSWW